MRRRCGRKLDVQPGSIGTTQRDEGDALRDPDRRVRHPLKGEAVDVDSDCEGEALSQGENERGT